MVGGIELEIRPVRPGEHERAGALVVAAYRALPGAHLSSGYAELLADVARRAEDAVVLVAVGRDVGAGALAGCVTYVPDRSSPFAEELSDGEAGVRMLAVDPASQGRGIGTALVEACIARARAEGRTALVLHTTPWMEAAHAVYRRLGFSRAPSRDLTPVPEVPLLAFTLALDEGLAHGRQPEAAG